MNRIERDQPIITITNVPPTEHNKLNGIISKDVYTQAKIPAVGPAIIDGTLHDEGYQNVQTIDPRFNVEYGKFTESDLSLLEHSDVVGITSMTRNREASLNLIRHLREQNPNQIIVVGGFDPTFKSEKWLGGEKSADFVVRKEGEKTIVELLHALKNGETIQNIKGISYKKNGEIIHNEERELLTETELAKTSIPRFPDYIKENCTTHPVIGSRGCPGNCEFCSVRAFHEGKYRKETDEKIIKQIKNSKSKRIFFVDDNAAPKYRLNDAKQTMQNIIDNNLNNKDYFLQLDTVSVNYDPELIKLMRKMGVLGVFLGIESMDEDTLKGMHKPATVEQNRKAIKIFSDNGIYVHAMTIAGSEKDTYKSIEATNKWLIKAGVNSVQIFAETPIPGSQLGERKIILPKAEEDTNLIDGQYVVTLPPDGITCFGLQRKIFDMYREFYSRKHLANSLKPLRKIYSDPKRAVTLTAMNFIFREYGRSTVKSIINNEYTKDYLDYLKEVDQQIYDNGKRKASQDKTIFDPSELVK